MQRHQNSKWQVMGVKWTMRCDSWHVIWHLLSSMPRLIVGLGEPTYQVWKVVIHNTSHSWIGWAYVSSVKLFSPVGFSLIMNEVSPSTSGLPNIIYNLIVCTYVLQNQIRLAAYNTSDPKSQTRGSWQRQWRPGSVCQASKGGASLWLNNFFCHVVKVAIIHKKI
jgi:hypothetical protein